MITPPLLIVVGHGDIDLAGERPVRVVDKVLQVPVVVGVTCGPSLAPGRVRGVLSRLGRGGRELLIAAGGEALNLAVTQNSDCVGGRLEVVIVLQQTIDTLEILVPQLEIAMADIVPQLSDIRCEITVRVELDGNACESVLAHFDYPQCYNSLEEGFISSSVIYGSQV